MPEFVEIEHPGIKVTALVPKSSLEHHKKAGWRLVTEEQPSEAWRREEIDAYGARLGVDTTGESNKAAALAAISLAQDNANPHEES